MKTKYIISIIFLFFLNTSMAQVWHTDIDTAKKISKETNRNIVIVFQGSDWCAPCIKLHRDIWESTEFKNYAKEHFVLVKADFPRRKKNKLSQEQENKNKLLAEKYNKHGYFPYIIILDNKGQKLGATSYKKISPKEYIKLLSSF